MHISLMCCKCARLYVPLNFILLTFMSVLYGIGFGSMSARMSTYIVFAALGLTVAIVAVLTIVAALPCFDMTGWGIYLCFAGIGLVTFGSVALILGMVFRLRIMFLVYSILITVIYSLYLIYDTQLILGGRKYEISSEEYIVGTVCLYTDFIYIFLALMNIINCMQ
ncbi:PREDICTED: protein lifeguard 3-like [Nicrophorus vespilloides]|uniref:Protein lifeguard 3-like n=1 Tax=Nicrophorus vespilloides TaxID=110193 RepID=A0ABM1N962_NICVS|nr:PREDICTED: protein lifeguard 3-like [Nicrophorus vespilloides]